MFIFAFLLLTMELLSSSCGEYIDTNAAMRSRLLDKNTHITEKKLKLLKFQEGLKKRSQLKKGPNNTQPALSARMQRYELGKIRKKEMELQREISRQKKLQDEFNQRVQIDSPEWVERYPSSVFCKNFTDVKNKNFFKSITVKNADDNKSVYHIPCIPALILPVALDPHDFVNRLFKSIDHCVSNLYIFKSDEVNITEALKALDTSLVRNIVVRSEPFPIRLTRGWNSGVREIDDVKWYLFCANDVEFAPFQLGALNRKFWLKSGLLTNHLQDKSGIDFAYFNWKNMMSGGYNLFIVKKDVFDKIGLFDENMHPAFFEDADWDRRMYLCNLIPESRCKINIYLMRDVCPWHGKQSHKDYESGTRSYEVVHPEWPLFIANAFAMNEAYYRAKWGCPLNLTITPQNCKFIFPFNNQEDENTILPVDKLRPVNLKNWNFNETRIEYMNSFLNISV